MAIEAFSNNELLNFVIYDTISAKPTYNNNNITLHGSSSYLITTPTLSFESSNLKPQDDNHHHHHHHHNGGPFVDSSNGHNLEVQAERKKKKRKRSKPGVCKNKEEAETQRMTHIVVERNRRRQMNDHLAVLRSLMPQSYSQRGDQASIVGGAIEFVKELEHLLQSLEAQKLQSLQQMPPPPIQSNTTTATATTKLASPPFGQFFAYPQYTWSQTLNKNTQTLNKNISSCCSSSNEAAAIADIEVTLIETHANLRILARRRSIKQLLKMVAGFQTLRLTILHLNVTTMDPLVLYSVSVKVEEGCQLTSVDDIAGAVHHMLRIIEEEEETVLY